MKPISSPLQTHLDGELTTLAYLVKMTRVDAAVFGFTTCDQDIVSGGVTYKADGAFTPSALESAAGLATDNLEITGILNSGEITDADLAAGLYDHARIDVYACNWADLTQGTVQLRRGWIGEVTRLNGSYVAELRGFHDLLQRPIGAFYTAECRFDLGDSSCGINLPAITVTGTVGDLIDRSSFYDYDYTEATDTFAYGKLVWTSGANNGAAMEVKGWNQSAQIMSLWLPMANPIVVGDTYTVYPGCDKRFTTCKAKFSNGTKFGGFPYIPGVGNILKYPDSH